MYFTDNFTKHNWLEYPLVYMYMGHHVCLPEELGMSKNEPVEKGEGGNKYNDYTAITQL